MFTESIEWREKRLRPGKSGRRSRSFCSSNISIKVEILVRSAVVSEMPRQCTVAEFRLDNIVNCLRPAVTMLNNLHDTFGTPFALAISHTTLALVESLQNMKRNSDQCIQLMERIHVAIYGVVALHIKSEMPGRLPPAALHHVGKFTETLHKIRTYVEMQQDGNRFKQFFRQSEMNTLLKSCHNGLEQALEVFQRCIK
ncbi:hypothetical protein B0H16DRAFT_1737204 [Mycena metata]|uniref:Uncharacterized protein n=1 Tax=Mycena metata TaxID=1033252 RepID=A0AAD7HLV9_9AGAR|nr:hypothetical protein B0H16DRAFT_1737204 [Mycena metata]